LPCGEHLICHEHLVEKDVVKENRIKCNDCNKDFQIKDNDFKSNRPFKKLIEDQSYLNEEEIGLKLELEESIRKIFKFYDDFTQNRAKLQSDVHSHFEEIRSQIDQHRDKLIKRIDAIALSMLDETKNFEDVYLKSLKESFSSFDHGQSLDAELNQLEDTFRNPNLLIQSIKQVQLKQKESLNEIQFKLNEMTKIKENLEATNEFKPNIFLFNQEEACLSGTIELNQYSFVRKKILFGTILGRFFRKKWKN